MIAYHAFPQPSVLHTHSLSWQMNLCFTNYPSSHILCELIWNSASGKIDALFSVLLRLLDWSNQTTEIIDLTYNKIVNVSKYSHNETVLPMKKVKYAYTALQEYPLCSALGIFWFLNNRQVENLCNAHGNITQLFQWFTINYLDRRLFTGLTSFFRLLAPSIHILD